MPQAETKQVGYLVTLSRSFTHPQGQQFLSWMPQGTMSSLLSLLWSRWGCLQSWYLHISEERCCRSRPLL